MSQSFSEPADDDTAEADVEANPDQVEPSAQADHVGRVAEDDTGYTEEQAGEARSAQSVEGDRPGG